LFITRARKGEGKRSVLLEDNYVQKRRAVMKTSIQKMPIVNTAKVLLSIEQIGACFILEIQDKQTIYKIITGTTKSSNIKKTRGLD
jgi:hypothetical protein